MRAAAAGGAARSLRLGLVSTYPPRRCGLAAFSADLAGALIEAEPDMTVSVCAVDSGRLSYPPEVATTLAARDASDYPGAARRLAELGVDVVLIQHEYCIFGGPQGRYVLGLADELRRLGVPYLVTLHTVKSQPTRSEAEVLARLCRHAAMVTVFTPSAVDLATANGLVSRNRLAVVPHGVPEVMARGASAARVSPAVADVLTTSHRRRMLSTFGLLTPAKGVETAIWALGALVDRHPSVRYIVAGQTHPNHVGPAGRSYADTLRRHVTALGLADHVTFVDQFLELPDLAALLAGTEIHLTPYRSRDQISSGTLTFAVAAGCAAVSTDYHYARDLLKPDMGALVPPNDPTALARALDTLLSHPTALSRIRATNRRIGQQLTWPVVARNLVELIRMSAAQDVHSGRARRPVRRPRSQSALRQRR
jgi:glycosyltransferase involved in cell wall biosynthesis